jgi:D-alanyl-D-alanine carboxypeptidase
MPRAALVLCLLLLAAGPGRAEEATVDAYIQAEMAKRHIPGLSLAVVRDGKVVLTRGYGMANVEHGVPARPETAFQLASLSKPFTAAAVLLLVEDGKVGLDDPISRHLALAPEAWSGVTVRHLLNHTSGIKSYTSLPDFLKSPRKDYEREELVRLVSDLPLEFEPGSKWDYNNTGYFLLGMIIEKASGKSYAEFLSERLFTPLGMTATRVNDHRELIPNRANGYSWLGRLRNGEYVSPTQPFAAGALISTVEDLARWDAALDTDAPLTPALREQMWTPTTLADGSTHPYGFGWGVSGGSGPRVVEHGGGIPGFSTQFLRFPDHRLTVIVLANLETGSAGALARGVAGIYVSELAPPPAPEPIEDTDPAATERLRKVVQSLADGTADPEQFTPRARQALFPDRVRQARELFGRLGELRSLELLERREENGLTHHRYRVTFGDTPITMLFALDADGKIAGVGLSQR